ncbi:hypothetical protein ElyMa_005978400 [Elysia marginata]|uniref:DUF6451 domain-containing protein n=1 Tax=Elysia marginata TaxID=1093978 RepID=A0AAV4GE39_9GAST|nr:hypothetical protein ElyMa_005978400 [Elysia marginata]
MLQKPKQVKIILHFSRDDGASLQEDQVMFNSQSRKETVERISPSSAKSLRIGSWNVRTMYEAGKTAQVVKEMHQYRLHILGISETHWNQSGQKMLTSELLTFSGNDEEQTFYKRKEFQVRCKARLNISKSLGLRTHNGKSKVLRSGLETEEAIILGTEALEEVVSFTYLGSIIELKGGTDADIKARIGNARSTYRQLHRIWKAGNKSQKIKIRLYNSNVKSVLLYHGCETWKATPGAIKKVQTFINRL